MYDDDDVEDDDDDVDDDANDEDDDDDDGFYAFCVDEPEMSKLLLKTQIDLTIASVLQNYISTIPVFIFNEQCNAKV